MFPEVVQLDQIVNNTARLAPVKIQFTNPHSSTTPSPSPLQVYSHPQGTVLYPCWSAVYCRAALDFLTLYLNTKELDNSGWDPWIYATIIDLAASRTNIGLQILPIIYPTHQIRKKWSKYQYLHHYVDWNDDFCVAIREIHDAYQKSNW